MTKPIPSRPIVCKRILLVIACIFFTANIFAQVGISSTSITPDATSILELRSTTLGFLAPRMTTTQRDAITTPATGLLIYNTTTNQFNFYSASWQVIAGGGQAQLNGTGFVKASGTTISYDNSTYITNANVVFNNQANNYTAGMKQTFQSSVTTAGFNFGGITADPSSIATGDHWYRTDLGKLFYRDGSTSRALVDETLTQTLTNKTLTSPVINSPTGIVKGDVGLGSVENTALSTWAGSTNIASLGTISTGSWNGTLINPTYGGTGVNNGIKTITLGGNLITSGANALTFTTTGATNVTLPTSGTVTALGNTTTGTGNIVLATSPTITGQTLSSGTTTVAPIKFSSGTNLTTPAGGAMEYDGKNLYFTTGTSNSRKTVALTGSSRIKILPRDFQATANTGYPIAYAGTGIKVSLTNTDYLYATIEIPTGYIATAVQIYGNNTAGGATGDYFIVYSSDITTGTLSSALCTATIIGNSVTITNTSANITNFLVVKIGRSITLGTTLTNTDIIYGGYVSIITN